MGSFYVLLEIIQVRLGTFLLAASIAWVLVHIRVFWLDALSPAEHACLTGCRAPAIKKPKNQNTVSET
jgi:hypothetical protein